MHVCACSVFALSAALGTIGMCGSFPRRKARYWMTMCVESEEGPQGACPGPAVDVSEPPCPDTLPSFFLSGPTTHPEFALVS